MGLIQKLRLMPDSIMEDMDMVLDMLVLDTLVSDMLDTDMDILAMDTPPLDTTVRDLLMLSQRPRLMLDSTMEDMDMVLDLDMLVSVMLDTDMDILLMDTPPLDTMARDLLMLSQRPRLMLDFTMEDMDMVLAMPVLVMPGMAMDILPMVLAIVDTIMVKPISFIVQQSKSSR